MLVLRYTTGTLLARQNHQSDMQGSGYKTQPHSLHATAATRLYQSGVDEQWKELDIVALKVYTVTRGPQTHSAKHLLTSSRLTPAMRSVVSPLFLPLQAPPARSTTPLTSATPSLEHFTFIHATLYHKHEHYLVSKLGIYMRRVFTSSTCPVCSRRGRPIAYHEVEK